MEYGKYGIIREVDMWSKRPEFSAWLAEVKKANLEQLSGFEEKNLFKEFMEDHNTATFPSKKYYNLAAWEHQQMTKRKGRPDKPSGMEMTEFNDEDMRREEIRRAREKQKEEEVLALKRSMESGMAQAMRDQERLKEELRFLYQIGNYEGAAAIQKRLEPDDPSKR
ncbi:unnamed protein product [Closterium sp. Yama58-4]|nr:unnamed protein product [Closterium sp. Yama58-4]